MQCLFAILYTHKAPWLVPGSEHICLPFSTTPFPLTLPLLDVGVAMRVAAEMGWPLTFRGGGTSLSGQALSEGLTVDVRRHFRGMEVLDGGLRVRVQPGLTIAQVNGALARHGRKLGPDPASSIACTIGGMIANNSSGMTCGTTANAYRTIDSMTIALPSGTVVDLSLIHICRPQGRWGTGISWRRRA